MPRLPNLPLHGADFLRALEMRDDHDKTSLMGESEAGNFERVNALLKRGVSVDAIGDHHGRSALILAVENGHDMVADLLLSAGADPNLANADGFTPLLYACRNGYSSIARRLVDAGANVNVWSDGQTAIKFALNGHHPDAGLAAFLVQRGSFEA